jgi:hypothetical protein
MGRTAEQIELQAARESSLIDALNARFARELAQVLKLLNADGADPRAHAATEDGRLVATKAQPRPRARAAARPPRRARAQPASTRFAIEAFDRRSTR